MIVVTGGSGFIGSNLIKRLNEQGESNILVVDNLKSADKYRNLVDLSFADYLPKSEFLSWLGKHPAELTAVFHQGACTDTLEYDGEYMLANNFEYSKMILHHAVARSIPMVYASSAAVYGHANVPSEIPEHEAPLNIYGYSKLLFDQYARRHFDSIQSTVVGLRYFNVYGNREGHKGKMSSMVFQFRNQIRDTGVAKLFGAAGGYGDGEQRRDFVYVEDLIDINLFFWQRDPVQTVVNAGSGTARTWKDVASAVIAAMGTGRIEFIPFPSALLDKYQFYTQSDVTRLRSLGFTKQMTQVEEGIQDYFTKERESQQLFSRKQ